LESTEDRLYFGIDHFLPFKLESLGLDMTFLLEILIGAPSPEAVTE
jgi:hypothetical protein